MSKLLDLRCADRSVIRWRRSMDDNTRGGWAWVVMVSIGRVSGGKQ